MKFIKGLTGLIVVIAAVVTAYYIFFIPSAETDRERTRGEKKERPSYPDDSYDKKAPAREEFPKDKAETSISIIIDDIGYSLAPLKELLKIEAPIAFAVLPHCPHSADAAELIHLSGRETLLHLPMEPRDRGIDPGPGTLFRWMEEAEIRRQLEDDLKAVRHAAGVNNHMGSAFMEDEKKLRIVFEELKEKGLFFIDSRTTSHSRAEGLAVETSIRYASRKLFIDNDQDEEKIFRNLLGFIEKLGPGTAVIIGHPYPGTVKALRKAAPIIESMGIAIVPPTKIVKVIEEAETLNNKE